MKKTILSVGAFLLCGYIHAQSVGPSTINASGGSANVSGNTFEYSVGEMAVVSTQSAAGITITQGVLQPMPPQQTVEGIEDVSFIKNNIAVYPNPAQQQIFIDLLNADISISRLQLLDISGKLVQTNFTSQAQKIVVPLADIAAGQYVLSMQCKNGNINKTIYYTIQKQ